VLLRPLEPGLTSAIGMKDVNRPGFADCSAY
jgi:hypothetical protein